MFQEYTAVIINELSDTTTEIMLHLNEQGKLIYAYCWANNKPTFVKQNAFSEAIDFYDGYREYTPKTKPTTNKLFLKLPLTIANYFNQMYISCNDDKGWDNDEIMLKAIARYPKLHI